jgi:hypothetical protein
MTMLPLDQPAAFIYIAFALFVAFQLLRLGRSALAFLRDLDDYRANRPK